MDRRELGDDFQTWIARSLFLLFIPLAVHSASPIANRRPDSINS